MTLTTNPAVTTRTIAAEARFVEEGHRALLDTERHCFRIVSDSRPGVVYQVTIGAQGQSLRGHCNCPAGRFARDGVAVPCKHVGGCFHSGEAKGWARWTGERWVVAGDLVAAVRTAAAA